MTVIDTPAPTVTAPERRKLMGDAYDLSGATNVAEARALAGLEWDAVHRPIYIDMPDDIGGGMALAEKERYVIRDDTGDQFGAVGREHKILTNADFFEFADVLLGQADTTWADADPMGGALANGKQPFLSFKLGEGVQIGGEDAVNQNVLLSNGHVGNSAFTVTVLPVRYRCSNVVLAALAAGRKGRNMFTYSVQHSGDLAHKVTQAREALDMTASYMREFNAIADRLADVSMAASEFDDFVTALVPVADTAGDRAKATAETQRAALRSNWRNTATITDDLKATRWGAFNIVTEVIDHGGLDVRKSKIDPCERRMRSVHYGTGASMRQNAFGILAGV